MYTDEYPEEIKAHNLMTDQQWHWLFTPEGLQPFYPVEGEKLDDPPIVEVWYVDSKLTKHCAVMVLVIKGAAPGKEMQHQMFRTLGEQWIKERWMVYAVRMATMSVIAPMRDDEPRPENIEQHPQASKARLVSGLTIDGRSGTAWAEVQVGKKRRCKRVKPWDSHVTCDPKGPDLAVPHLHTAFAAYGRMGLRKSQPTDASRN